MGIASERRSKIDLKFRVEFDEAELGIVARCCIPLNRIDGESRVLFMRRRLIRHGRKTLEKRLTLSVTATLQLETLYNNLQSVTYFNLSPLSYSQMKQKE